MSFAATASFQGLGYLQGTSMILAYGVSADGSFVVGWGWGSVGLAAFRWTQSGGMQGLGDLPGGDFYSLANSVSATGSIVVGYSYSALGTEAFRWTQTTGMQGLGDLPGGVFRSHAYGISDNGVVIVGFSETESGEIAFRWTESDGMQILGDVPGGQFRSNAKAVSADGKVIVGFGISALGGEAFRWTESTGMQGLGDLPGGSFGSDASSVSADGNVIVGCGHGVLDYQEAIRWTEADGMISLGYLPDLPPAGISLSSNAWDVSADGSIVVGHCQVKYGDSGAGPEAFIWDEENGTRSIKEMLENDYGLNLTGWRLQAAHGISNDGFTIVGYGISPGGNTQGWIATLPGRPSLLLHAPNGSESITAGTIYPIGWSSDGVISDVLIEYSTNNGQAWNPVNPPNIGNTGSYGWSVPMTASQNCLIRIS